MAVRRECPDQGIGAHEMWWFTGERAGVGAGPYGCAAKQGSPARTVPVAR